MSTASKRDMADLFADGRHAAVAAALDAATPMEAPEMDNTGAPPSLPVRCVADLEVEPVTWIWKGRIAAGTIAILDGDPGLGKSTLTADLVARLTRGEPLPGDTTSIGVSNALLVSYEDHAASVIKPRLCAAGADVHRVDVWDLDAALVLPDGLAQLEAVVRGRGARLVVIDPLAASLGGEVNAHKDQDVRRVLAPVAAMAGRTGPHVLDECLDMRTRTGIMAIMHFLNCWMEKTRTSKEQLAAAAGLSYSTVDSLSRGRRKGRNYETLRRLTDAMNRLHPEVKVELTEWGAATDEEARPEEGQ